MSEDKLYEIKGWIIPEKTNASGGIKTSYKVRSYFAWLISELEKCRAEVKEKMELAYRAGVKDGHFYRFDDPSQLAKEFMKAMENMDE